MQREELSVSRMHFPITALGPGRRIGLWLQGCSIRCPGCMSRDTWSFSAQAFSVQDVIEEMTSWFAEADGLTVSGGEPFDQPRGLHALLCGVRTRFGGDVLVYSGYAFETLEVNHKEILNLIDALITDPFDETHETAMPLRGSANQRFHLLTPVGSAVFSGIAQAKTPDPSGSLDLLLNADGTFWIAGVPRRGDLDRLSRALTRDGIELRSSAGRIGDPA